MNGFKDFFINSPIFVVKESGSIFVNDKIRTATLEEVIESFRKKIKHLEDSGVEFSKIVIDSYDNIE